MAITPGEAAKLNDAKEREAVLRMEKLIDEALKKEFRTGGSVGVGRQDLSRIAGWTKKAQEEVFKKFKSAGWTITEKTVPDRMGSYTEYVFTATSDQPIYRDDSIGWAPYDMDR